MPTLFRKAINFKLSIRFTVVTVFVFATMITACVAVALQYYFTKKMATNATVAQFNAFVENTSQYLDSVDSRAIQVAKILASYPKLVQEDWVNDGARDLFAEVMRNNTMFYAIYLGFENGDFYELINLDSNPIVRKQLLAQEQDRWVIIKINGKANQRRRYYEYYDANFLLRASRDESSEYNATLRPWYLQAEAGKVNKTAPYLFHNLQAPGQTYSTLVKGSSAVIAVDIALSSLSQFLASQRLSHDGEVFIYQKSGEIIASNRRRLQANQLPIATPLILNQEEQKVVAENPVLSISNEMDWAPIDFAISGRPAGYSIDYLTLISQMTGFKFNYVNGFSWSELVEHFKDDDIDILQPVFKNDSNQQLGIFSEPFLTLPYSLVTHGGVNPIHHIDEINGWTVAIPTGWSIIEVIEQNYPDIHVKEVASTRDVLKAVLNDEVDAGLDVSMILSYTSQLFYIDGLQFHPNIDFSPVSFPNQLHFVINKDKPGVANLINRAIATVTEQQQHDLQGRWLNTAAINYDIGTVPYAELINIVQQPKSLQHLLQFNLRGVSHFVYVSTIGNADQNSDYFAIVVPASEILGPTMEKVMLSIGVTIAFLLLLTPIPWLFASPIVKPIRALAEENEKIIKRQFNLVTRPASRIIEIDDLGKSMVDMSESIQQYEENQKELMDSFIELIAGAIDDKSPYTAGHCERVPELAFMLVKKAEQCQDEPFKDFRFANQEQWREFRIGAWLHDCGKITTPEFIVDKGSKLETIYNRIHEIRMRFEVLLRDAEIDYWKQYSEHPEQEAELRQELEQNWVQIKQDFEFVARSNVGGEFLSEENKQRIKQIAATKWVRHLSDRLGLSPLEETRLNGQESSLPVEENLLMDKPEHLIERLNNTDYAAHLGIQMEVPHYLYNQGELYNLLIERGTLTTEDRFKINEHIIATIKMLDKLPLPSELAKVPQYASTHHETMIGTGYPRKLTAGDLSIPERIMVLADIFEALTAADRPYKKAKPVSVAVEILYKMVLDQHIDVEVFELFLTSGVYLEYAQRFLPEKQIDSVDISKYLRHSA